MRKAYQLAADLQGDVEHEGQTRPRFVGATATLSDNTLFNIGEALEASKDGVIVVEEPELQRVLDEHPALVQHRGEVPDKAPLATTYTERTHAQLLALPAAATIAAAKGMSKDELVQRIQRADVGEDPNVALEEGQRARVAPQDAGTTPQTTVGPQSPPPKTDAPKTGTKKES
jgi:hypothetical protein